MRKSVSLTTVFLQNAADTRRASVLNIFVRHMIQEAGRVKYDPESKQKTFQVCSESESQRLCGAVVSAHLHDNLEVLGSIPGGG